MELCSNDVQPVDDFGHLRVDMLDEILSDKTRIMAVTHISNVLGIINPVKDIISRCHSKGVPVLVDGAQGAVHCKADVQDLDCDFYVFSGHKLYAGRTFRTAPFLLHMSCHGTMFE